MLPSTSAGAPWVSRVTRPSPPTLAAWKLNSNTLHGQNKWSFTFTGLDLPSTLGCSTLTDVKCDCLYYLHSILFFHHTRWSWNGEIEAPREAQTLCVFYILFPRISSLVWFQVTEEQKHSEPFLNNILTYSVHVRQHKPFWGRAFI